MPLYYQDRFQSAQYPMPVKNQRNTLEAGEAKAAANLNINKLKLSRTGIQGKNVPHVKGASSELSKSMVQQ